MSTNSDVKFVSISEFKSLVGAPNAELNIFRNPNTNLISGHINEIGKYYKCQNDIDFDKPIKVLIPIEGDNLKLDESCIINVKESTNNVLFTL